MIYQLLDPAVITFACSYTNRPIILKTVGATDDNPSYYKWLGINRDKITLTSFSTSCLGDIWMSIGH